MKTILLKSQEPLKLLEYFNENWSENIFLDSLL